MTDKDRALYEKTVRRLNRMGKTDPTAQIVALAEEIEYYRERIRQLLEHEERAESGLLED